MKNIYKISFIFLVATILCFSCGVMVFAQVGGASVQTSPATNISNSQVTLNGYLGVPYISNSSYVYFQWGTSTDYNNQSDQQYLTNGSFSRSISGLNTNTTYHFRAVAQGSFGTIYGQDMTFYSSGSGHYGNGTLNVSKQVINISSGNLGWQALINAKPSDVLSFAVTLQANNQNVHNVMVRDILPANLIYRGNLAVNTNINYGGDITSGINVGTIYAGQPVVVSYQAQVASADRFSYGTTTLTSSATVTSSGSNIQTGSATVIVNKSSVAGASIISTGLTNDFLTDSFLFPLLIILAGTWLGFSGQAAVWASRIKARIKR